MSVPVTVATFNIRNGHAPDGRNHWLLRRNITARWLAGLDADITGLQEAYDFQLRHLSRHVSDRAVAGRGRNADGGGEQVPVLVRRPFRIREVTHRWFGPTPDVAGSTFPKTKLPRLMTIATCSHPGLPNPFRVANLHLDHRSEDNRRASLVQLAADIGTDLPVVVMGDFNAAPTRSGIFSALLAAGFREVPAEGGTFHAWGRKPSAEPQRIDLIFVRDGGGLTWEHRGAEVIRADSGRLPSDHWPVRARLQLG